MSVIFLVIGLGFYLIGTLYFYMEYCRFRKKEFEEVLASLINMGVGVVAVLLGGVIALISGAIRWDWHTGLVVSVMWEMGFLSICAMHWALVARHQIHRLVEPADEAG